MKGLLIFAGGVVTGAAITLGVMGIIYKRRNNAEENDDFFSDWEEITPVPKPEKEEPKENKMKVDKSISEAQNDIVKEYVSNHKELPKAEIDPWIMTDEEWNESPYEKAYLTYYAVSDVLADENLRMIDDNRCGSEYVDNFVNGIVHVCNEDEQVNYEIRYFDGNSFEEDSMGASDDDFYDID